MAENFYGLTDTGKIRSNNEDTFIAQTTASNRFVVACVIDGVGGYNGGEVAAAIAREEIIKQLNGVVADVIPAMISALRLASKKIYQRRLAEKELESMACVATLAMVDTESNQFYYAHVGDTRLYLLRDGSLVKISKDHSFVGFLEDSGRLTESAAMAHPKRNEINKALGFDQLIETDDAYVETGQSPFLPGDTLLICSDGLTDMADKKIITDIVTQKISLQQKATLLIEAANSNGGKDNVTVVLVQNNKAPQQQQATMPLAGSKKKDYLAEEAPLKRAADTNDAKETTTVPTPKKSNGIFIILSVLCLLLLASTIWLYLQWKNNEVKNYVQPASNNVTHNDQEIKLQSLLNNAKGDTLILPDTAFKQPVILSDTLHISRDTLYIKGNLILKSDSSYKGPAIVILPNKHISLEGVKFDSFNTGILSGNADIQLKSVQFLNCKEALHKLYLVESNSLITSDLPLIKFKMDSLVTPLPKPNGNR